MTAAPRVGIVGGGILGTVLGLRLAQAGAAVTVLESAPSLGGLAGAMQLGAHTVDRFYHVVVPGDASLIGLAEELGLGDELRFRKVGAGFFIDGALHDFNGVGDFLRFSPLTPWQRLRLGAFVAYCQLRGSYAGLERVALDDWLVRTCGTGVTRRIWTPLLDSRFEGRHAELPATYLWARTRRMSSARTGRGQAEEMGHLIGGHQRLIDAAADAARAHGAAIEVGAPVEGLVMDAGRVTGIRSGGESHRFDLVIPTLQPPALARLLPERLRSLLDAYPRRYLGVVSVVMTVRKSVSPYYAVNICDPTPITTVVEASHVLGTDHTDGLRLVYLPRYCDPDAREQTEDDESVFARFTEMLKAIAPGFDRSDVVDWTVQRARLVEPVHALGAEPRVAPVWPRVPGLALASNAQVYPRLLNGDSVIRHAEDVAGQAARQLGLI